MATREQRQERKQLKQKLFYIRRHIEGEDIELTAEHKKLKKKYEANSDFTGWSGFPDKWDVGDPNSVKDGAWGNEVDRRNFEKAFGKSYQDIISKEPGKKKPMKMKQVTKKKLKKFTKKRKK